VRSRPKDGHVVAERHICGSVGPGQRPRLLVLQTGRLCQTRQGANPFVISARPASSGSERGRLTALGLHWHDRLNIQNPQVSDPGPSIDPDCAGARPGFRSKGRNPISLTGFDVKADISERDRASRC
jgi:hypothetical protein